MAKKVIYTKNKVVQSVAQSAIQKQKQEEIIQAMFRKNLGRLNHQNPGKSKEELFDIFLESDIIQKIIRNQKYGIAPNLAFEVLDQDKVIITSKDRVRGKTIYQNKQEQELIETSLDNIKPGFFGRILEETQTNSPFNLPKEQTGSKLIENVIKQDQLYFQEIKSSSRVDFESLENAYEKLKQNKEFILFDTETLGGNNTQGLFQLDKVYDISYLTGNIEEPTSVTKKNFILGITKDERDKLIAEIDHFIDNGEKSSRSNVIKKMAVIYGKSELEKDENGVYRMVKQWDGYSDVEKYDKEDYKKGIERLFQIGEDYRAQAGNSGLTQDKVEFAKMLRELSDTNKTVIGHNSSVADIPWLNIEAARMYNTLNESERREFLNIAGWDKMKNIDVSNRHLDTLHLMREAGDTKLLKEIYTKAGDHANRMIDGHSPYAQEAIAKALFGTAGEAHTSIQDTLNLLNILTHRTAQEEGEEQGGMFLDKLMNLAKEKAEARGMDLKGKNVKADGTQIFMTNRSMVFREGTGAFSFTVDPVSNEIRTSSGWDIGEKGVRKNTYGQNAFKKDRFLTLDSYMKVDVNSEEWEKLAPALHELNASELHIAKFTPIYDKNTAIKEDIILDQPIFIVAQTEEQLRYAINSRNTHVGEIVDGQIFGFEDKKDVFTVQRMRHTGEIVGEAREDLASAIKTSTYNEINDRARRKLDDMTLTQYERLKKIDNFFKEKYGEDFTPKQAKEKLLDIVKSHDKKIATQVSEGKVVNISLDDIQGILENKVGRNMNELNNIVHLLNYYENFSEIGDVVAEVVKNTYDSKELQDLAFTDLLKNVKAQLSQEMIDKKVIGKKDIKELYQNTTDKFMFKKDLNTFTFNLPSLFGKDVNFYDNIMSISEADTSIVFDFNNDQSFYGLAEKIHEKMNGKEFVGDRNSVGYKRTMRDVLYNFADHVNNTKEYAGIFNDLLNDPLMLEEPTTMSMRMFELVDQYRKTEGNELKGLPIDFSTKNVFKEEEVFKYMKKTYGQNTKQYVQEIMDAMPTYKIIGSKTNSDYFDFLYDYIDNQLIKLEVGDKKFSVNQVADYLKELGYKDGDIEIKHISNNIEQTRRAYRDYLEDFIKNFSQNNERGRNGVEFIYDKKANKLVMHQGKVSESVDNLLPKIVGTGTGVKVQTENSSYAFMSILNLEGLSNQTDEITSIDPSRVHIQSNIHYSLQNSQKKFDYKVKRGAEKNNMIEQAKNALKDVRKGIYGDISSPKNNKIPHISPTVGYTAKEVHSHLMLDRRDFYNKLPELARGGLLNEYLPEDIIENLAKRTSFSVNDMQMYEATKIAEVIDQISIELLGGNEQVKEILENINYNAMKHSMHTKGLAMIGKQNVQPLAETEGTARPVMQSLTIRQSREDLEERIANAKKKKILTDDYFLDLDEAYGTPITYNAKNATVKGIGRTTDSVVTNTLNLSDIHYKKMVDTYLKENDVPEPIRQLMTSINLTEQEKFVDGRVADTIYNATSIKKIKEISDDPYLADMSIRYKKASPTFKMQNGKVVVSYGKGLQIDSKDIAAFQDGFGGLDAKLTKTDSILEYGFFSEGMLLSEKQVNKAIAEAKTIEEAKQMLEEKFGRESGFYLRPKTPTPYIKVIHGANEKDMTRKLLVGLGTIDEDVKKFLIETGLEDEVGSISGKIEDVEQMIKTAYTSNEKRVKKLGFKSYEEVMQKVYDERYKLTDTIQDMFKQNLGLEEKVAFVANHDKVKHQSIGTAFREHLLTMRKHLVETGEAKTKEEAMQIILKDLNEAKVFGVEQGYVEGATIMMPEHIGGLVEVKGPDGNTTYEMSGIHIDRFQEMVTKNKRYEGLYEAGELVKSKLGGEEIASVSASIVSQVQDVDIMSSSAGLDIDLKEIESKIKQVKADMNARPEFADEYIPLLRQLEAQKKALKSAKKEIHKGRTYGRRDIQALGLEKNDQFFMKNVMKAFQETGEIGYEDSLFEQIMGHMLKRDSEGNAIKTEDGRYLFKDSSKGKATLHKHIENIKKQMMLGKPGDTILRSNEKNFNKVLDKRFKDEHVRQAIQNLFEKHGEMSVEFAEKVYGAAVGDLATQYNSNFVNTQGNKIKDDYSKRDWLADKEKLESVGFKKIGLEEMAQETGYNARTTVDNEWSIFKRNSLIDLGEDFGEGRYIAMGYIPNAATENNVIATNAQSKIYSLLHASEEYKEAKKLNKKDADKAKEKVLEKADELRKQIYEDTMGKYGQFAQLNKIEAAYSTNVKTSSFFYMDENTFNVLEPGEKKAKLKKLFEDVDPDAINYHALQDAHIAGVSLSEHYKNNRYYNVRFEGIEGFEKRGLFENDVVNDLISNKELKKYLNGDFLNDIDENSPGMKRKKEELVEALSNVKGKINQKKEILKFKLQTEGIMGDLTRPPVIYTESTGPAMLFLDTTLEGNQSKVPIEAQLAYNGDNDGDTGILNIMYKRVRKKDGSYKIVTSLNSSDEMFKDSLAYMTRKATGANRYFRTKAVGIAAKDAFRASDNTSLSALSNANIVLGSSGRAYTQEEIDAHAKTLNSFFERMNEAKGTDYTLTDLFGDNVREFDNYLEELSDQGEDVSKFLESYVFYRQDKKTYKDTLAKEGLAYTGHVNKPLFQAREILDLRHSAGQIGSDDLSSSYKVFSVIEQKIISSKKGQFSSGDENTFTAIETKMKHFTDSFNKLINYDDRQSAVDLRRWLLENEDIREGLAEVGGQLLEEGYLNEEFVQRNEYLKELANAVNERIEYDANNNPIVMMDEEALKLYQAEKKALQNDLSEHVADNFVSNIKGLNNTSIGGMRQSYNAGTSLVYKDRESEKLVRFVGDEGIHGAVLDLMIDTGVSNIEVQEPSFKHKVFNNSINPEEIQAQMKAFDPDLVPSSGQGENKVIQSIGDALSHLKRPKNGMSMFMLGTVSAVIAAGAVGGNPSEDTGLEAAKMSQVSIQDLDQMSIQNQPASVKQSNKGYVININGIGNSTSVKRASNKIANTMGNSFSSNVNINMNINRDNRGLVNDRDIEQFITDAIIQ